MKYVLYIDYRGTRGAEYQELPAKNLVEAIIRSDAIYDENSMYLMRIMEKTGRKYKYDEGITSRDYVGVIDKRWGLWCEYQGEHTVAHDTAKWGDWYRRK